MAHAKKQTPLQKATEAVEAIHALAGKQKPDEMDDALANDFFDIHKHATRALFALAAIKRSQA